MRAKKPRSPGRRMSCAPSGRRGVILLAVLISITLLSLIAYQYADLMLAEYRAAENSHRTIQARAIAESGVYYTAGLLATPTNVNNVLGGNIYNNPQYFMDIQVPSGDGSMTFGRFTLIAPPDPMSQSSGSVAYGVIDEGAKLNINVLMQLDPTGNTLYNALMMLPNMTSNVAYSIVDWVDSDNNVSPGGAEDDYYTALSPPYHCKNGPLESLEELLLVQGVTPLLLFGGDVNRNGIIDGTEDPSFGLGWSAFLTAYSREANSDGSGTPYNYLNSPDVQDLYNNLSSNVDANLAAFIILYRQYGGGSGGGNAAGGSGKAAGGSGKAASGGGTATGDGDADDGTGSGNTNKNSSPGNTDLSGVQIDFTMQAKNTIKSMWSLVNATVTVPGTNGQPGVTYSSPLGDPNQQANLLPLFFNTCTLSPSNEIPARVNINTAPQEVLYALQGIVNPGMNSTTITSGGTSSTSGASSTSGTSASSSSSSSSSSGSTNGATVFVDTDIQTLLSTRPAYSSGNPPGTGFDSVAWLYTQANLSLSTLQKLEPYITARTQVYRVQSVGYIDDSGPAVRVEAIIDTNGGRPRIAGWRDLTALGKGWDKPQ